jgi:hypothetical protein
VIRRAAMALLLLAACTGDDDDIPRPPAAAADVSLHDAAATTVERTALLRIQHASSPVLELAICSAVLTDDDGDRHAFHSQLGAELVEVDGMTSFRLAGPEPTPWSEPAAEPPDTYAALLPPDPDPVLETVAAAPDPVETGGQWVFRVDTPATGTTPAFATDYVVEIGPDGLVASVVASAEVTGAGLLVTTTDYRATDDDVTTPTGSADTDTTPLVRGPCA